jgi:hypothetical protein
MRVLAIVVAELEAAALKRLTLIELGLLLEETYEI